jgi:flagellar FliL protein
MKSSAQKKSGKDGMLAICCSLLILLTGSVTIWVSKNAVAESSSRHLKELKAPAYIALDPFAVNLAQEEGDKYLHAAFTVQVDNIEQVELFKKNLPLVRSQFLILLTAKKPSDVAGVEGKNELLKTIQDELNKSFLSSGVPVRVTGVFATSFVIQY